MRTRTVLAALVALLPACAAAFEVDVVVDGPEALEDEVRAASLVVAGREEGIETAQDLVAAARADYTRIVGRLYSEGFYGPVVSIQLDGREAARIAPLDAPARIGRVVIAVRSGAQFRFGQAIVAPLAPGTELPEEFAPGERALTGAIREAAQAGVEGWRDTGRALARIDDQEITALHPSAVLNAEVRLAPGPVLHFAPLRIEGAERVREDRLRAIAGLPVGEVFDPGAIERAEDRLRRTGAFTAARIIPAEEANPDGTIDATLTVVEQLPRRFGFGAEIESDDGAALEVYWLHRNLLGGAERLRLDFEVSGIDGGGEGRDYRAQVLFNRPATFRPDVDLQLSTELERLDEPAFEQETFAFQGLLTRYATEEITVAAGLGYRYARTDDAFGTREFQLLELPVTARVDRRDDPLDPTGGYYADLDARGFAGLTDGDGTGLRVEGEVRGYRALGTRVVAAGRLGFGSVIGADRSEVPADFLFFSGGSQTVRGQPYESLGIPIMGREAGGASRVTAQAELRVGFTERIGGVLFADYGILGEESFGGETRDHAGAGIGLRYRTGIGSIRLDVGAPVSGDTGDGVQVYIGIGQAF
ncbi:autotransporter secretion outer membrane protein TamA [Hasllibacter halocynthiae]|uniref:Autotransporter secretion outer membrane protein TamA n=1 Tax=Hasllibacter halocynthiae TaxID=595589 RepID=A0A2T0X1R8_9RHOB|nr:BamA/TamA family outer membrane protein [Hasllibacter halocynthiae]PRY92896.1 autotransporter secretion outer membrane protein TamA [Hasllibacter halocynthiae]